MPVATAVTDALPVERAVPEDEREDRGLLVGGALTRGVKETRGEAEPDAGALSVAVPVA